MEVFHKQCPSLWCYTLDSMCFLWPSTATWERVQPTTELDYHMMIAAFISPLKLLLPYELAPHCNESRSLLLQVNKTGKLVVTLDF